MRSTQQGCGAAMTQKSAPEPNRHVKCGVRVCKAGSQNFIPDIWSLLLFSCLTEQLDRMIGSARLASTRGDVGTAQPRLAQALSGILIMHQGSRLTFIPLALGWMKPIRNISSVSACTFVWVRIFFTHWPGCWATLYLPYNKCTSCSLTTTTTVL